MSGSISEQTKYVSPEAIQRLVKDIINLNRNPLTEQGIYYEHDSQDMLIGRAMIIGPKDTPYAHGFYFFEFEFFIASKNCFARNFRAYPHILGYISIFRIF